jgi:hypothetical protein
MLAGSRRRAIMQDVIGVLAIWRYPVKAMLGEPLDAVEIGPAGCTGDRRWIVVDADTGERIANKRGPTDPRLRACRAELLDASDDGLPLRITLPGGEMHEGRETERAIVAHHRLDLGPFGRQGCAGAYAEVVRGGRVEVGGRLEVARGRAPRDEAIRAAVARLAERLGGT